MKIIRYPTALLIMLFFGCSQDSSHAEGKPQYGPIGTIGEYSLQIRVVVSTLSTTQMGFSAVVYETNNATISDTIDVTELYIDKGDDLLAITPIIVIDPSSTSPPTSFQASGTSTTLWAAGTTYTVRMRVTDGIGNSVMLKSQKMVIPGSG
jgi:hypothetical protein